MRPLSRPRQTTVKFSPQEKATIRDIALTVWNYIGYDCIMSIHVMQIPGEKTRTTMTRAEVIEVVLDAGRVEERITDADLRTKYGHASYEQLKRIVRTCFPQAHYGL